MRLYVFDIDGTLTDSIAHHQASFLSAYSAFDIPRLDTNWSSYTHHSDSWIFGEVFRKNFDRNPTQDESELFVSALCAHFEASLKVTPVFEIAGATNFLSRVIRNPNLAYAFATGSFRPPALRKLEALGVPYAPELLVTATEHQTREDIVSAAIEAATQHFRVERFERITSFGDGYWDLVTAKKLGIDFIGIAKDEKAQTLKAAGAVIVYSDFLSPELIEEYG